MSPQRILSITGHVHPTRFIQLPTCTISTYPSCSASVLPILNALVLFLDRFQRKTQQRIRGTGPSPFPSCLPVATSYDARTWVAACSGTTFRLWTGYVYAGHVEGRDLKHSEKEIKRKTCQWVHRVYRGLVVVAEVCMIGNVGGSEPLRTTASQHFAETCCHEDQSYAPQRTSTVRCCSIVSTSSNADCGGSSHAMLSSHRILHVQVRAFALLMIFSSSLFPVPRTLEPSSHKSPTHPPRTSHLQPKRPPLGYRKQVPPRIRRPPATDHIPRPEHVLSG